MRDTYYDSIMLIERLHRLFLDVIKQELDRMRIYDINNVQCLLIYNIGDSELSIGELSTRGYYMGTNVSYNLRKLVEYEYVIQQPSLHDKRSSTIKLSPKGIELHQKMQKLLKEHQQLLEESKVTAQSLKDTLADLKQLEQVWSGILARQSIFRS
jgi:DNA-binding MarR family transcriptional regulator